MHASNIALLVLAASAAAPVLAVPPVCSRLFSRDDPADPPIVNSRPNARSVDDVVSLNSRQPSEGYSGGPPNGLFLDDPAVPRAGSEGVATTNTRGLDDQREIQARGILGDTSGRLAARDLVDDFIAQVIKSRDVNPERTMLDRRFKWKWYDDAIAAETAALILRDSNPNELAQAIKSRDVNPEMTTLARRFK